MFIYLLVATLVLAISSRAFTIMGGGEFEGLKILGFGICGVKLFGIWGKHLGFGI